MAAMSRYYCYREVLPFTGLVAIECVTVGGTTLYKAATTSHGFNYYVFIVYTFLIGSLLLLPCPFFLHRRRELPPLKFSVLLKISFLSFIGYVAQIIGYIGINYCSPTLSSAMGNLIPAFTFIIAFIFRMEKLNLRSFASQAKLVGTILSISGALVATIYNGPRILFDPATSGAATLYWLIGGLFLAGQNLLLSIIYVYQAQIMQEYPVDLIVVLVYDISGLIVAFLAGLIMARNIEDWKLKVDILFAAILYMGFTAGFLSGIVHTWALRMKGPLYVAMFKPLSILIAFVMGVLFLGDTLHLGSVIGGAVISIGFYAVVWGKAKEEKSEGSSVHSLETSTTQTVPFLQAHGIEGGRASV